MSGFPRGSGGGSLVTLFNEAFSNPAYPGYPYGIGTWLPMLDVAGEFGADPTGNSPSDTAFANYYAEAAAQLTSGDPDSLACGFLRPGNYVLENPPFVMNQNNVGLIAGPGASSQHNCGATISSPAVETVQSWPGVSSQSPIVVIGGVENTGGTTYGVTGVSVIGQLLMNIGILNTCTNVNVSPGCTPLCIFGMKSSTISNVVCHANPLDQNVAANGCAPQAMWYDCCGSSGAAAANSVQNVFQSIQCFSGYAGALSIACAAGGVNQMGGSGDVFQDQWNNLLIDMQALANVDGITIGSAAAEYINIVKFLGNTGAGCNQLHFRFYGGTQNSPEDNEIHFYDLAMDKGGTGVIYSGSVPSGALGYNNPNKMTGATTENGIVPPTTIPALISYFSQPGQAQSTPVGTPFSGTPLVLGLTTSGINSATVYLNSNNFAVNLQNQGAFQGLMINGATVIGSSATVASGSTTRIPPNGTFQFSSSSPASWYVTMADYI